MTTAIQQTDPEGEPPAVKPAPLAAVPAPIVVKTPRALMLAAALDEEREQRQLLARYVQEFLVEGEDFGVIPGMQAKDGKPPKKCLFKPGAEKLLDLFRCRPEYEVMVRDVDRAAGLYYYELKCRTVSRETDTVLNEGVGSASSYESKYRYRIAGRVCPACRNDTIIKGQEQYGGGWICFKKKGGCGAKFADGSPEIEGQTVGKVQNPDLADVANTVLKMAKKRALVDAAIALARVSDMFTQDVEDMPIPDAGEPPRQARTPAAAPPRPAAPSAPPSAEQGHVPLKANSAAISVAWKRAITTWGEEATERWNAAGLKVCGDARLSKDWTAEQLKDVEAILFQPSDIEY